jgi:hypothetical protein
MDEEEEILHQAEQEELARREEQERANEEAMTLAGLRQEGNQNGKR